MEVLPVVHVLAVVAAALHGRAEPLEVSGVVGIARFPRHHPHPLGSQNVRGNPMMTHSQSG